MAGRLTSCSAHCQSLMSGAPGLVQVPTCLALRVVLTSADTAVTDTAIPAAAVTAGLPLKPCVSGVGGWLRAAGGGAPLCRPASAAGCWGGNGGAGTAADLAAAAAAVGRPRRALRSRMGYSGAACCCLLPVECCCRQLAPEAVTPIPVPLAALCRLPQRVGPEAHRLLLAAPTTLPPLPRSSGWAGSGGRLEHASGFQPVEGAGRPAGKPACTSANRTDFLPVPSCCSPSLLPAAVAVLSPSPAAAGWPRSGVPSGCMLPSCSSASSWWLLPPAQNSAAGAAGSTLWERTSPVPVQQTTTAAPHATASRAVSLLMRIAVTGAEDAARMRACCANSPRR